MTRLALAVTTVALLLAAPAAGAAPIDIRGLQLPTSLTMADDGRVFISEKGGVIKTAPSIDAATASTVLDISATVGSHGDHGLTSVAYSDGFLYATYTLEGSFADDCVNFADGCAVPGRLSRWPVLAEGELGPEEVVVDGAVGPGRLCVQATTHGIPQVTIAPDGAIILSTGDGANFVDADIGQHLGDPCGNGGALRAQNDASPMGKIVRIDPHTGAMTTLAKGLRNPFRQTYLDGTLYTTDTGWYSFEEINRVDGAVKNFGWPCYEGVNRQDSYDGADVATCESMYAAGDVFDRPVFAYPHPERPDPGANYASISAIAGFDGRIYFGDYTQRFIDAIEPDGGGRERIMDGVFVDYLFVTPDDRLVYIDIVGGGIHSVIPGTSGVGGGGPPLPPTAEVTMGGAGWSGGQALEFSVVTSLISPHIRQPATIHWDVELVTGCNPLGDDCANRTPLEITGQGMAQGTVVAPSIAQSAYIEATVTVTNASATATAVDSARVENGAVHDLEAAIRIVDGVVTALDKPADRLALDDGRIYHYDEGDFLRLDGVGESLVHWEAALEVGDHIGGRYRPGQASDLDQSTPDPARIAGRVRAVDVAHRQFTLDDGSTYGYDVDDYLTLDGAGEYIVTWEGLLTAGSRLVGRYVPGATSQLDLIPATQIAGVVSMVDRAARRFRLAGGATIYAYDAGDYLKVGDTGEYIGTWEHGLGIGDEVRGAYFTEVAEVSELSLIRNIGPPPSGTLPDEPTSVDGVVTGVDLAERRFSVGDVLLTYDVLDDYLSLAGTGEWVVKWEARLRAGDRVTGIFVPGGRSELDLREAVG